jgi:hypothetical protein
VVWLIACFHIGVTARADTNACISNLRNIHAAIQHYRQAHKDLPARLSELVSDHLSDRSALICPDARSQGISSYQVANWSEADRFDQGTTYLYEFGTNSIPRVIPGGFGKSMREWKRAQMGFVGGRIPMVRCLVHGPALNLGFDGEIYESQRDWEKEIGSVVRISDLVPVRMLAGGGPVRVVPVPPRDPNTPVRLIDLGEFYNASLSRSWCSTSGDPASHLGSLPTGRQTLEGTEFDVRGVVQIRCERFLSVLFPVAVTNIPVGQRCARLQFLHAAAWDGRPGTTIGYYVVHFDGGRVERVPIEYGKHVIEWRTDPARNFKPSADTPLAWSGQYTSMTGERKSIHLYRSTWQNPAPETLILSLDLVAAVDQGGVPTASSAPFLIAVTSEP